jgi:hypothetical protein
MSNYFAGTSEHPYHLSVGAVLLNDQGEVAVHRFRHFHDLDDYYMLMRETIEPNESIEQTLARGLMEEFGATATLKYFLGSSTGVFLSSTGVTIHKTTLYFALHMLTFDEARRKPDDREKDAINEWHPIPFLIEKITDQAAKLNKSDSEADILKRLTR